MVGSGLYFAAGAVVGFYHKIFGSDLQKVKDETKIGIFQFAFNAGFKAVTGIDPPLTEFFVGATIPPSSPPNREESTLAVSRHAAAERADGRG